MTRRRSWLAVLPLSLVLLALGAAAAGAAAAPEPGRLTFWDFNTAHVYAVDSSGANLVDLTAGTDGISIQPDWSPDGRRIVFSSTRGGDQQLWVMNADGGGAHLVLGDEPGFRLQVPTYTPDGASLVYARCLPDNGVCAIWAAQADGTGAHALTPFQTGRDEAVDFNPAVSPDGTRIAFSRFFWHGIVSQVYVMGIDGSDPHPITPARFEGTSPAWTPDGQIVYSTASNRAGAEIRLVDAAGGKGTALTHTPFPHSSFAPDVSPSGQSIAYVSDRAYRTPFFADLVVQPLHGKPHPVPLPLNGVFSPRWRPAAPGG
jgi:TolB protein